MAHSHLLPPDVAVNYPAHPKPPSAGELLQAVLLGCYAALIVEHIAKLIAQHQSEFPDFCSAQYDTMHHDIYDALRSVIAQLAHAQHCTEEIRKIGCLMQAFFSAECCKDQMVQRDELVRHLERLNACNNAVFPFFGVMRDLFVHLSEMNFLDPDDVRADRLTLSG